MRVERIGDGVFACLQADRGLGTSNSGLVDRGGGLVVDTFWDLPHTREMLSLYSGVWTGRPARVVNTHHNGDHCWGNQLLADAEIIGHRACAARFRQEQPERLQQLKEAADSDDPLLHDLATSLAPWDFRGIELTPPTTLVDERLSLDELGVELLWVGPAHTEGDLIIHVPDAGIVFTGDILFRKCTPIGWEGTFANWLEALQRIVDMHPKVIVPGHGPLCGVEGPREMQSYLRYVDEEAGRHFEAGRSALEAAKRIDPGPYAQWTEPERIVFSVERAYRERRGEPWHVPIDVTEMFRAMYEVRRARTGSPQRHREKT